MRNLEFYQIKDRIWILLTNPWKLLQIQFIKKVKQIVPLAVAQNRLFCSPMVGEILLGGLWKDVNYHLKKRGTHDNAFWQLWQPESLARREIEISIQKRKKEFRLVISLFPNKNAWNACFLCASLSDKYISPLSSVEFQQIDHYLRLGFNFEFGFLSNCKIWTPDWVSGKLGNCSR